MLIRCEKCQALFSLQDGVVRGAQGEIPPVFAVECGRCLAQFQAEAPASLRPTAARKTPQPPIAGRAAKPLPSAGAERPTTGAPTSATLARALKPNRPEAPADDDEFARELERIAKRRKVMLWIAGAAFFVAAIAIGGPMLRKRFASIPAAAHTKLEQARKKLLMDDLKSLEQAVELDAAAAKLAPGEAGPEGERAFALLLAAGVHKDLADRGEAKVTALGDEMAKLQIAKPDGFEKQIDAIRTQMVQLNDEREPHVHLATQLHQQGLAAAKVALEEDPDEPAALRAMALHSALNNAVDSGVTFADKSDGLAPGDAFTAYVRASLWLCGSPSREKQDRGLAQLAATLQAEPKLLRALYDTAAIEVDRQLVGPAREKLDRILAANPAHERAQHLRAALPAAP